MLAPALLIMAALAFEAMLALRRAAWPLGLRQGLDRARAGVGRLGRRRRGPGLRRLGRGPRLRGGLAPAIRAVGAGRRRGLGAPALVAAMTRRIVLRQRALGRARQQDRRQAQESRLHRLLQAASRGRGKSRCGRGSHSVLNRA
jgi:hypothetical protein